MRDAYDRFFKTFKISHDDFFKFGIDEIIHIPVEAAILEWKELKRRFQNNETISIRSFGRQGARSQLFVDLVQEVFGNSNVTIDKTNNYAPARVLERLSGFSKTGKKGCTPVRNYQISHVFGRTKNPYAFTAPWNIVFLPKVIDPFSGHEANGEASVLFRKLFQRHVFKTFEPMIEDFNSIVSDESLSSRLYEHLHSLALSDKEHNVFERAIKDAFEPIEIGD